MDAAQIIRSLGDTAEVAAALGLNLQTVSNWKLRGFPRSRLLDVMELAREAGRPEITVEVVRAAAARLSETSVP